MDWLKDKKNQPIVATIAAVVILGVVALLYFTVFAKGGSSSEAPPPDQSAMAPPGGPIGGPGGMMGPAGGAPGGMPGAGGAPQASDPSQPAQPAAAPAAKGNAGIKVTPMEVARDDPFAPPGYKPRGKGKIVEPKLPIADFPMANFSVWQPKGKLEEQPDLPQPVRRMAGLIVSDRLFAIIETNGTSEVVQPGDMLKDRLATVQRVERDKVVLKTVDDKPKYLTVRMAAAPKVEVTETQGGGGAMPLPMGRRRGMMGPMMGPGMAPGMRPM